jgi:hypothetical protein
LIRPGELLEHAQRLLTAKPPSQADLRRAVSASYYCLFHLFAGSSTIRFFAKRGDAFYARVIRTFDHRTMKETCRLFSRCDKAVPPGLTELIARPVDRRLAIAAQTFFDLQEARHRADYDLVSDFSYDDALQLWTRALVVASWWNDISDFSETDIFFAMLLLGSKLTCNG